MRTVLALLLALAAASAHADEAAWKLLARGGQVLMIRHASTTPGVGDPEGFRPDDCTTQRNLSEDGRVEAGRLGNALRERRIPIGAVVSSPWCRCIDTARLAFGRVDETWKPLSNLFGRRELAEGQVRDMRARIAAYRSRDNLVFLTHGSTVVALTGVSPAQAEIVVLTPTPSGFKVAGRIPSPR